MQSAVQTAKVAGTSYQFYSTPKAENTIVKPVVVLVHGLGLNHAQWQHQLDALLEIRDVLTYDLSGHGNSDPCESKPSLRAFSEQLRNLLTHLEITRVDLVGFSLGGMIVRRFCLDYPDLTRRLVIMNSSHTRSADAQRSIETRVKQASVEGPGATVDAALERWFTDQYRHDNPDTMALVRSWVLSNDARIYPMNYNVLASGVDEITAQEPPINCPTLVMTAENDSGSPADMADAIAAEISGARVVIIPALKHMALFEDPELINTELCNFLDDPQ